MKTLVEKLLLALVLVAFAVSCGPEIDPEGGDEPPVVTPTPDPAPDPTPDPEDNAPLELNVVGRYLKDAQGNIVDYAVGAISGTRLQQGIDKILK